MHEQVSVQGDSGSPLVIMPSTRFLHCNSTLCLIPPPAPCPQFCAYDYRVMEMAVALSKYVGEDDPLPLITEFAR